MELAHAGPPRCRDCGMELLSWDEYHTIEACTVFKATHAPQIVRDAMREQQQANKSERATS